MKSDINSSIIAAAAAMLLLTACDGSSDETGGVTASAATAVGDSGTSATPAKAEASLVTSSTTTMIAQFSGACVEIPGGSVQSGVGVDLWNCEGGSNQNFRFTATTDGYYTIANQASALCLDAGGGSVTTAAQITQIACSGANSQKWKVVAQSDGTYALATIGSAGCMDVYAGRTANGTMLTTYACHYAGNQKFVMAGFVESAAPAATIAAAGTTATTTTQLSSTMVAQFSGACAELRGTATQAGLGVDFWDCASAQNRTFGFSATADGYYVIRSAGNLCLDAGGGSVTSAVQVAQNSCTGGASQKWKLIKQNDGSFAIATPAGGGCLDVYAGRTANGTALTTYACHYNGNQKYLLAGVANPQPATTATTAGTTTGSTAITAVVTTPVVTTAVATTPAITTPVVTTPAVTASVATTPVVSTSGAVSSGGTAYSTLIAQFSGACVEVRGSATQTGLGVDTWSCAGASNSTFGFTPTSDGHYTIRTQSGNLCLDAGGGSVTAAAQVTQNACSGGNSQKWKMLLQTDGSYAIATYGGAGCMDVYAGRTANGTALTTYACHFGGNQRYVVTSLAAAPAVTQAAPVVADTTPATVAPTVSSSAYAVPGASADAAAPKIFNTSTDAKGGQIVSIQGANFDSGAQVWLAGTSLGNATQLEVVSRVGTNQMAVQLPSSWTGGMIAWVSNSRGASKSFALNGAVPWHLDTLQLVPGGAFRVLGKGLLASGFAPVVMIDGRAATVNVAQSNSSMLVVTAPVAAGATAAAVITVDNGNGSGAMQLDRTIRVTTGATGDPFALGVGWGAGFTFATRIIPVNTPCNGSQDDSANIQGALNTAASGGGVVQLPAGNCVLQAALTLSSNVVLKGAGKDVTFLRYRANYPIIAMNVDLVGLQDFTLVNSASVQEGLLWKQNTRSFLQRIKVDMGVTRQLFLTENRNLLVAQTDFIQRGSIGGQNPYLFSNSAGLVFTGNTTTTVDASPTFQGVHDALFLNNRFTRDVSNQNQSVVIATHRFVMDFAYRIAVIGNTFDIVNGPLTNTTRNDGETLLTEGGGGSRTENMGTVGSAGSSTLTDGGTALNVNPFGTGLPENYGIAIISGTGAGQTRNVTGYSGGTVQVDRAWDVVPEAGSRYATFVWGLEKSLLKDNSLLNNSRGIWLYQTGIRDVEVVGNTITNGGGIFLRTYQSQSARQFDPIYNVRIAGNTISNSAGQWMSHINVVFVNKDPSPLGIATLGIEVRDNVLTANSPNVGSGLEDYASQEGFMNTMRSEPPSGSLNGIPPVLGTIFQNNQCNRCSTPFIIGTGAYGTVFSGNQPGAGSITDWRTIGSSQPASIGTVTR